jgi:hypothetical protein
MKITKQHLQEIIAMELLQESFSMGAGVNVPGIKGDGIIRGLRGNYRLVHWQGKDVIAKIPEKNHVKKHQDLVYILKGEMQDGWNEDTFKSIVNRYPEKGVFTIETTASLESQAFTGMTSAGATGTGTKEAIDRWVNASADIAATILDAIPVGYTQVAAASITAAMTVKAVNKKDYLSAGLNIIALAPLAVGDAFKAAYPWIKKISQAAASDATSVGSAGLQLIVSMVNSWDAYKASFKESAYKAYEIAGAKQKLNDAVVDKIYDAVDSAVEELRKSLPEDQEFKKMISESRILMRAELRELIMKTIS